MTEGPSVRAVIQRLLDGETIDGGDPAQYGLWRDTVAALYAAHAQGGTPQVRATFGALTRTHPDLARLIADAEPAPNTLANAATPALPPAAAAIYEHTAPCGDWLDQYVTYAVAAAPMTPRAFHEVAGLIAVSAAIAGRLCLPLEARPLYPNIYALFLAPSTIAHKSTGFGILEQVMTRAKIAHLLMPHKAPPEAFIADLDPHKLPGKRVHDMDLFLARRAFAAQRCYIRDEVSALFASLRREFNTGLLELILGLYDCPVRYEETTISRGDIAIERGYLVFFGAATPIEMAPHLATMSNWSNGLWARFALISVDQPGPFVFFPPDPPGSSNVVAGLRRIYELFPVPYADYAEYETEDGTTERRIVILGTEAPASVQLHVGVWQAWETYSAAMHDLLCTGDLDEALNANYGRFGAQAMKVAMLLAAMDTDQQPVVVERRHFARAQTIVEGWRESLHCIWAEQGLTAEAQLMARIQRQLERAGPYGLKARDLCHRLRAKIKDVADVLDLMQKAGQVELMETTARNGRRVEVWRWVG